MTRRAARHLRVLGSSSSRRTAQRVRVTQTARATSPCCANASVYAASCRRETGHPSVVEMLPSPRGRTSSLTHGDRKTGWCTPRSHGASSLARCGTGTAAHALTVHSCGHHALHSLATQVVMRDCRRPRRMSSAGPHISAGRPVEASEENDELGSTPAASSKSARCSRTRSGWESPRGREKVRDAERAAERYG